MSRTLTPKIFCKMKTAMAIAAACALLMAAPLALQARVVTVAGGTVNVRQGASTDTVAVSKVNLGQIFGCCGAEANWTKIKLENGNLGYIRNDLLMGYDGLQVTGSLVRVRQTPSLSGAILTKIQKGTVLTVLDHQNGWFKVQFPGGVGWVSGEYSKLVSPVVLKSTETSTGASGNGNVLVPGEDAGTSDHSPAESGVAPTTEEISADTGSGILSGKIVVVDPGHSNTSSYGAVDPGTTGVISGIKEKDINLDISLKLRVLLESMGATVIMTHTGETSMTLYDRAAVANDAHADLFISIHSNSAAKQSYAGHTTYFFAPLNNALLAAQRDNRLRAAQTVQAALVKAGGRANLGIKENNYVVIRETVCPSILVEAAFLSNPDEDLLLSSGAYRYRLAQGLANGIRQFLSAS